MISNRIYGKPSFGESDEKRIESFKSLHFQIFHSVQFFCLQDALLTDRTCYLFFFHHFKSFTILSITDFFDKIIVKFSDIKMVSSGTLNEVQCQLEKIITCCLFYQRLLERSKTYRFKSNKNNEFLFNVSIIFFCCFC